MHWLITLVCDANAQPNWEAWSAIGTLLAVVVALFLPMWQAHNDRAAKRMRQACVAQPLLVTLAVKAATWCAHIQRTQGRAFDIASVAEFEARFLSEGRKLLDEVRNPEAFDRVTAHELLRAAAWSLELQSDLMRCTKLKDGAPSRIEASFHTNENREMALSIAVSALKARDAIHLIVEGRKWELDDRERALLEEIGAVKKREN